MCAICGTVRISLLWPSTPPARRPCQAIYGVYRVWYHWDSFSRWHITGELLMLCLYFAMYRFLASAASPRHAPLAQGGALISAGSDLDSKGVIEYTWDLLYTTMFVQLATGLLSDWFALVAVVPPCIGFYYAWTQYVYPWISKPDEPLDAAQEASKKQKVKYGRAR